MFPEIRTERFLIRRLHERDVSDRYLSWFSDKTAHKYITAARTRQTLDSLRSFVREKYDSRDALLIGIFLENGGHIGNIKFEPIDPQHGSAVVGILIGEPEWRGRGVFGEVFEATSRHLSEHLGIGTFWLGVDETNMAAIKAYKKCGFEVEAPPPHIAHDPKGGQLFMRYRQVSR